MGEFLLDFIRENPKLILAILALLVSTLGVSTAIFVKKINAKNRFYDKLEADSVYQINQNLKDIERILSETLGTVRSSGKAVTLQGFMEDEARLSDLEINYTSLRKLSRYYMAYCAKLNKYFDNVIPMKKICFVFQEHSNKARQIIRLFENINYSDMSLEFARIHLKNADIL